MTAPAAVRNEVAEALVVADQWAHMLDDGYRPANIEIDQLVEALSTLAGYCRAIEKAL